MIVYHKEVVFQLHLKRKLNQFLTESITMPLIKRKNARFIMIKSVGAMKINYCKNSQKYWNGHIILEVCLL